MAWTLVTGGAKNLGAQICKTLASHGYNLVIHYRNSQQEAHEVRKACRDLGVQAEVIWGDFETTESTEQFCRDYLHQFNDTQNLINNVGNYLIKSALETSPKEWQEIFQNNFHAPCTLIQAVSQSIQANQGCIVNLGVVGLVSRIAQKQTTAYTCAKLSLWMLTKSRARDLASTHVRVNMVSPGYLVTAVDLPSDFSKLPMGRPAELKEVADVIAFLLKDTGEYITGQNIEVAGGLRL